MSIFQKAFILTTFLLSIFLDQTTKNWSETNLLKFSEPDNPKIYQGSRMEVFRHGNDFLMEVPTNADSPWVSVQLNYVRNFGAAWGFLRNMHDKVRLPIFHILTIVFCSLFIWTAFAKRFRLSFFFRLGLILAVSGAVGNFIDRLTRGYVVDFIDVKWNVFRWTALPPVFNVADMFVVLGLMLVIVFTLIMPAKA